MEEDEEDQRTEDKAMTEEEDRGAALLKAAKARKVERPPGIFAPYRKKHISRRSAFTI